MASCNKVVRVVRCSLLYFYCSCTSHPSSLRIAMAISSMWSGISALHCCKRLHKSSIVAMSPGVVLACHEKRRTIARRPVGIAPCASSSMPTDGALCWLLLEADGLDSGNARPPASSVSSSDSCAFVMKCRCSVWDMLAACAKWWCGCIAAAAAKRAGKSMWQSRADVKASSACCLLKKHATRPWRRCHLAIVQHRKRWGVAPCRQIQSRKMGLVHSNNCRRTSC